MAQNKSLIFAEYPDEFPVPGKNLVLETSTFDLHQNPPEGGLIIKTHYFSYDPYQRGRMNRPVGSYISGFKLGEPITNDAISTVVKSSNPRFKEGDVIIGMTPFQEYVIVSKSVADEDKAFGSYKVLSNPLSLDPAIFLGALGLSGLTAYSSFYEIGKPKAGDVIFVSAASGAVGQIVGQLAKREGLIVIGSVGSAAKLDFIKEKLGFDEGFNYKTEQPDEAIPRILKHLNKKGLDIYYDNVGGEQLDAALEAMSDFGRVVSCGSVSQTSRKTGETYRIKNMPRVVTKRLTIRGFIAFDKDFLGKYGDEHQKNMQQWIKSGELKVQMSVTDGMDNAAAGLVGMLNGENFGKAVLKVSDL